MTAAPLHAIGRRLPSSLVILAALSLAGCQAGADRPAARKAAGSPGGDGAIMESAGDVVIAPPSGGYAGGSVASPGSVSGTVSAAAPLTVQPPVASGKDSGVCGAAIPDSSVVQTTTGLGGAVVWLEGIRKGKPIPLEKRLELESVNCLLTPRVQAGFVGGAVNVIGHDPFRQHLRFLAGGETAPRAAVLLGRDEQVVPSELPLKVPGLVIVRDLDHAWPRAYVAVFDHPYFTVTRPDGSFTIDQVPAGTYTLMTWHERTGRTEQKVIVAANGVAKVAVKLAGK